MIRLDIVYWEREKINPLTMSLLYVISSVNICARNYYLHDRSALCNPHVV